MEPVLEWIGYVFGIVGSAWGIATYLYTSRKSAQLYKELRRVTWDEIRLASHKLRKDIEKSFQPSVVFAPCRRGATIANLMFDNEENVLLHVGIRIDKRVDGATLMANPPTNDWQVAETEKYYHYIPQALVNLLAKDKMARLLILDDYAMTGDALKRIIDFFLERGVERRNLKTATLICTAAAREGKKLPDFYWHKTTYSEFYFPWGKAV